MLFLIVSPPHVLIPRGPKHFFIATATAANSAGPRGRRPSPPTQTRHQSKIHATAPIRAPGPEPKRKSAGGRRVVQVVAQATFGAPCAATVWICALATILRFLPADIWGSVLATFEICVPATLEISARATCSLRGAATAWISAPATFSTTLCTCVPADILECRRGDTRDFCPGDMFVVRRGDILDFCPGDIFEISAGRPLGFRPGDI
jgi:hypothetical protein